MNVGNLQGELLSLRKTEKQKKGGKAANKRNGRAKRSVLGQHVLQERGPRHHIWAVDHDHAVDHLTMTMTMTMTIYEAVDGMQCMQAVVLMERAACTESYWGAVLRQHALRKQINGVEGWTPWWGAGSEAGGSMRCADAMVMVWWCAQS